MTDRALLLTMALALRRSRWGHGRSGKQTRDLARRMERLAVR